MKAKVKREERILAVCPSCAHERTIQRDQVGMELVCSACGTRFCVLIGLRRGVHARTPDAEEIESRLSGDPGLRHRGSASGMIGVLRLTLALVAFLLLAFNFDSVFHFLRDIWSEIWPLARHS